MEAHTLETNNCASCTYFHAGNGNCTAVGGFCTAVPAAKCPLLDEYLKTGLMPNDVLDLIGSHGMAILELVEAKKREKVRHDTTWERKRSKPNPVESWRRIHPDDI